MACKDYDVLWKFLADFTGQHPVDAVVCFFQFQMGMATFSMLVFGGAGAALTIRTRSMAPVLVAMMLSSSVVFATVPAPVMRVGALIMIIGITVAAYILYQRSSSAL